MFLTTKWLYNQRLSNPNISSLQNHLFSKREAQKPCAACLVKQKLRRYAGARLIVSWPHAVQQGRMLAHLIAVTGAAFSPAPSLIDDPLFLIDKFL